LRACHLPPHQAQARAYRIGQTRPVLVVRLLVGGSVEEHVARVAAEKAKFADSSITGMGAGLGRDRGATASACPHGPGFAL
jgi:SNF2 family DNA or RNA helicase